jgi:DNA-binding SARP family transcriptional activator
MEFAVLGPLAVTRAGARVTLETPMLRRLLALLLCQANRPVTPEAAAEALWYGRPPRTARKTLQVYVHRLRRVLEGFDGLRHCHAGYRMEIETKEMDSLLFEERVEAMIAARAAGDLDAAVAHARAALALWRGDAYAGINDVAPVAAERIRLEDKRLSTLEERMQIEIELGNHAGIVADLAAAVVEHPYRERLRGLLMLALYRSGRQADALEAYRQARERLSRDLGIEPVPELRRLHQLILRGQVFFRE